jgi:hypothetical protein
MSNDLAEITELRRLVAEELAAILAEIDAEEAAEEDTAEGGQWFTTKTGEWVEAQGYRQGPHGTEIRVVHGFGEVYWCRVSELMAMAGKP